MSKIIRTARLSGRVLTLGQAERDLYLKASAPADAPSLDLAQLVAARVDALRQQLEQRAEGERRAAVAAVEEAAAQRLLEAQTQGALEARRVGVQQQQEGYQKGLDEREAEAREAVERMAAVHAALKEERGRVLREAEELIVDLAIAVARRIVRAQVELDRALVARTVRAALEQLGQQGALEVLVNPDDLGLVRRFCQRWAERADQDAVLRVRASEHVERGGCMVEGETDNVDARLEQQLAALHQALRAQRPASDVTTAPPVPAPDGAPDAAPVAAPKAAPEPEPADPAPAEA